ncbi:beta-glucosidase [Natronosporangium hydrolyticum]|uniref:Beta-glucosidase n=1 Tax=Natronosporangium hydrolyticum TaxID=2811111 RepID=A0A895YEB3_9ACTN|nr:GH1 family beta-glucosidase [Natronosporangium hydrolyticum]QSB12876.1 beta-glucosidase [Natronosporangium hydrolyticum]
MTDNDGARLPAGFVWGVATAAYQIEGAVAEGGRGPSIWDTFVRQPDAIFHGDDADRACDHYHRWESDLDLMAELGIPAYRLSLSWARLQPAGSGPLNPEGVEFYRTLIAGCRARGIEPYVTLYHWDLPQPLQDAGGWPDRATAQRFGEYAALVADELGDLAEYWITINEPWCAAFLGHAWGMQAPGHADETEAVRAAHHLLLAHGLALAGFRQRRPAAKVGITNIVSNLAPVTDSPADVRATATVDVRMNRLFLEPVYRGRYGAEVVAEFGGHGLTDDETGDGLVRPGDLALIAAPTDFVGINHYTNTRIQHDPAVAGGVRMIQVAPTPTTFGWSDTPDALREVLLRVARDYSPLPIYVTENGATFADYPTPDGEVRDPERVRYLAGYTAAVAEAVAAGADVRGYFAWSFLDNFEWSHGYSKRFGLVYVDYPSQRRIPKQSAYWYRDFIAHHRTGRNP